MKNRSFLLIILSIIAFILLFAFSIGILIAFIKDKGGDNYLLATFITLGIISWIYVIRDELKIKKVLTRKKSQFNLLGKLLFKNYLTDFELYYNAYLLRDDKNLRPIEVLHEFAESKGLSIIIDCNGEENDGEIEYFINSQLDKTISWTNTNNLREKNLVETGRDEKYIIRLIKAIDKDLKVANKKLLFFDLATDSYIFTVTDITTFKDIIKIESEDFHGTEKFKHKT